MWAAQYYKFDRPRRWINSGGLGTMGVGLPYAMGCQFAYPDALVACITGEASIQMCIQELSTAQQYNLPGSGGFTDVSSSINVVTDAGAGNIRVILADGVQFVAAPGQYQLNPMTNQLQVLKLKINLFFLCSFNPAFTGISGYDTMSHCAEDSV